MKKRPTFQIRLSPEDEKTLADLTEATALTRSELVRFALRRLAVSEGLVPPRGHHEYGESEKPKEMAMFLKRAESSLNVASVDLARALHRLERKAR